MSSFEVYDFVAEHDGIISMLQILQVVVAKSDFCGLLAGMCHYLG